MNEIYLPILEMRSSPMAQKTVLLNTLQRLCRDPQALVEVYLNYDCDRTALENLYERLMNVISRLTQTLPAEGQPSSDEQQSLDVRLKHRSLECLCSVLQSLVAWMGRFVEEPSVASADEAVVPEEDRDMAPSAAVAASVPSTQALDDDPGQFESAKQRLSLIHSSEPARHAQRS